MCDTSLKLAFKQETGADADEYPQHFEVWMRKKASRQVNKEKGDKTHINKVEENDLHG